MTNLGPGATFGEVALLKEDDCVRTASIIASDDEVDLIEIDRDLYNRCARNLRYDVISQQHTSIFISIAGR